ncbi:MAG: aldehyde dehydrogenase family protein, partial [Micromonosporaceae bacterium]
MPAPSPDHVALPFLGGRVDIAERAQVRNPANWDEVVGHVGLAGAPQVDAAVTLAADSLSAWPALPAVDRAEHLLLAAAALES